MSCALIICILLMGDRTISNINKCIKDGSCLDNDKELRFINKLSEFYHHLDTFG